MLWIDTERGKEECDKHGMGKHYGKCRNIGHIEVPQLDWPNKTMYYFCFNCRRELRSRLVS